MKIKEITIWRKLSFMSETFIHKKKKKIVFQIKIYILQCGIRNLKKNFLNTSFRLNVKLEKKNRAELF